MKNEYKASDSYDRESFTFRNLTERLDPQIDGILKDTLGAEYIQSSVVGLRLSDRMENEIEVDFLVFMERRGSENTGWYKTYTPEKMGQELFHSFSEFRAGNGDVPFATYVSIIGMPIRAQCILNFRSN